MKTFQCACGQIIFFENISCLSCGRELGFLPDQLRLSSLEPAEQGLFRPSDDAEGKSLYRKCRNYSRESVCNWMIPNGHSQNHDAEPFCASCRLNQTIPDLSIQENHALWALMETAKRRLVYSLLNLKLPIANKTDDPAAGLAFNFLSDVFNPDGTVVRALTGHDNGLITLNIAEADDAVREKTRHEMNEPYRTLLGHFRHEVGHYYWDRLVRGTRFLEPFRELFGSEEPDYGDALKKYYAAGPLGNWQESYISAYATSHPWEDWAETWAHFLHIQDALEVANDFGLAGNELKKGPGEKGKKLRRPSEQQTIEDMVGAWSELAIALNSINRSMGLHDTYPFMLPSAVVKRLGFILELIDSGSAKSAVAAD